jgi:Skp family chaperone for outer membrane proteins
MKAHQELRHELREKYLRAVEDGDEAAAMYKREFREAEEALAKVQANLQRKEAALGSPNTRSCRSSSRASTCACG